MSGNGLLTEFLDHMSHCQRIARRQRRVFLFRAGAEFAGTLHGDDK
jgi:hypothetical protein